VHNNPIRYKDPTGHNIEDSGITDKKAWEGYVKENHGKIDAKASKMTKGNNNTVYFLVKKINAKTGTQDTRYTKSGE
jgi:hypothetical protein